MNTGICKTCRATVVTDSAGLALPHTVMGTHCTGSYKVTDL